MKNKLTLLIFAFSYFFVSNTIFAQKTYHKMYIYWGWNRASYTNSDIHFKGNSYDFTLSDVVAKDRQTPFGFDPYFHPLKITIPQTNFRIGYALTENWDISLGADHMKYIMVQNQIAKINGTISNSNSVYNKTYINENLPLTEDFLTFEHTDGLNYLNLELRRNFQIKKLSEWTTQHLALNLIVGGGGGMLVPKSNVKLLENERNDEFHIAGWGVSPMAGCNLTFWKYFFLQSEYKFGYINMPSIRTTKYTSDSASQQFFFHQVNIMFGFNFFI